MSNSLVKLSNQKRPIQVISSKIIKGCIKNNIASRGLKGYNGNALKPESVKNLTSLGPI